MTEATFLDKIIHSLPGRIFIVITQTVLSSLLLLLTFVFRNYGDITLLKLVLVLVVGLLAGFSARRILAQQSWTLKLLTGIFSAVLSLGVLHILSAGFIGIDLDFGVHQSPDWLGLIQLFLAAAGVLLVTTAFRKPRSVDSISSPQQITARETGDPKRVWIRWPSKLSLPLIKIGQRFSSKSRATNDAPSSSVQGPSPRGSSLKKLTVPPTPKTRIRKTSQKLKKARKDKKKIKLIGQMEHTCPYCLDPVEPKDPRGVKVCPICKTHHHADCWGITGACQIPHSQQYK
jgi:hypothetical protein